MTDFDKASFDKLLEEVALTIRNRCLSTQGCLDNSKKALAERMLQAELAHHLAQQRQSPEPIRNHKNGSSRNRCRRQKPSLIW